MFAVGTARLSSKPLNSSTCPPLVGFLRTAVFVFPRYVCPRLPYARRDRSQLHRGRDRASSHASSLRLVRDRPASHRWNGSNLGVGNMDDYDQEHPRLVMAARPISVLAALALGLALGCVGVSPVQVPVPTPNPVPAPRLPPTSPVCSTSSGQLPAWVSFLNPL